jgi:hypothetical protein
VRTCHILLSALFTTAIAWAQAISTSQINGTVRDAMGLAVPGAEVKATQTATGFVLIDLPIGPWIVMLRGLMRPCLRRPLAVVPGS